MKVAFWDNQLCERGSTTAMFDYALCNQSILGNESFIFYDCNSRLNKPEIIYMFKQNFEYVVGVSCFADVDDYLKELDIPVIYIIKSGQKDDKLSNVAKNCIHCVFQCNEPHGDVYASVSPWVEGNGGKYPVVPHMINLPSFHGNLRSALGIPSGAIVIGGYGGPKQFNITWVQRTIRKVAKLKGPKIYFLFANFVPFDQGIENIKFLPAIYDRQRKVEFINTCDAMIHACSMGETFGLAIAEFSSCNKPVFATKFGNTMAHVELLGSKGIWYSKNTLMELLMNFIPDPLEDYNAYKDYSPEKVMTIFKEVFLDGDV